MPRTLLAETSIHPVIRAKIDNYQQAIVQEVQAAVAAHDVVVVGMSINPFPKKACKALDAAGIAYQYLQYGSYFSDWRRRSGLKLWTGWPTFPMVFVKGTLVGGFDDLTVLIASGEIKTLLAGSRN